MVAAKQTTYSRFEGNLDNNITKVPSDIGFASGTLNIPSDAKFWETTNTVYDSLGGKHTLKYTFYRGVTATGDVDAATDSDWVVTIYDQDKNEYYRFGTDKTSMNTTATADGADDMLLHLKFGTNGLIDTAGSENGGKVKLTVPSKNGSSEIVDLDIDFSKLTQFANESNAAVTSSDGYPQGALDTFSIGPTGEIYGIFTNGISKVIGQIALAVFKNPAGLEKTAENMFQVTPNSGDPIIGLPGSSGLGSLNSGTLEMSNVDISREFAEMISTQRGFQANSRIITTSDEMLQELVNLKR
jgi:flagellar hook protein FlgE